MSRWFGDLARDTAGTAVVEFALGLPVLLLLVFGIVEVGRAYQQANAIERGLRAAALFAARTNLPLSSQDRQRVENLARTGTVEAGGTLLAPGWALADAAIDIDTSATYALGSTAVPLIRVTASVPFDPLFPNVLHFAGFDGYRIRLSQSQAYVGY